MFGDDKRPSRGFKAVEVVAGKRPCNCPDERSQAGPLAPDCKPGVPPALAGAFGSASSFGEHHIQCID